MLDDVGLVADDTGDEDLSLRQLYILPDHPLMFVARVGSFDGISLRINAQDHVDDFFERHITGVRRVHAAPAEVIANAVFRNPTKCMVVSLDILHRGLTELFPAG